MIILLLRNFRLLITGYEVIYKSRPNFSNRCVAVYKPSLLRIARYINNTLGITFQVNLVQFPFDEQRCYINVTSFTYDITRVRYHPLSDEVSFRG